jgi:hypothetical protein
MQHTAFLAHPTFGNNHWPSSDPTFSQLTVFFCKLDQPTVMFLQVETANRHVFAS